MAWAITITEESLSGSDDELCRDGQAVPRVPGLRHGDLTGLSSDVPPGAGVMDGMRVGPLVATDHHGRAWSVPVAILTVVRDDGVEAVTCGSFHPADDANTPIVVGA